MKSKFLKIGMPVIGTFGVVAIAAPVLTSCSETNSSVFENFAAKGELGSVYQHIYNEVSNKTASEIEAMFKGDGQFVDIGPTLSTTSPTITEDDLIKSLESQENENNVQKPEWLKVTPGSATISGIEIKDNIVVVTFSSDINTIEEVRDVYIKQYEVIINNETDKEKIEVYKQAINQTVEEYNWMSSLIKTTSRTMTIIASK